MIIIDFNKLENLLGKNILEYLDRTAKGFNITIEERIQGILLADMLDLRIETSTLKKEKEKN